MYRLNARFQLPNRNPPLTSPELLTVWPLQTARRQCQGARAWYYARALSHRTGEKYKHYGPLTVKHLRVLGALLWKFHNADSGRCFPGYDKIKDEADCHRDTVYEAIHNLERLGILTWVHRIKRERECVPGLFGDKPAWRWRVVRMSNAYTFNDPKPSKSEIPTGTTNQDLTSRADPAHSRNRRSSAHVRLCRARQSTRAVTNHGGGKRRGIHLRLGERHFDYFTRRPPTIITADGN
jgi:hypothetical protein